MGCLLDCDGWGVKFDFHPLILTLLYIKWQCNKSMIYKSHGSKTKIKLRKKWWWDWKITCPCSCGSIHIPPYLYINTCQGGPFKNKYFLCIGMTRTYYNLFWNARNQGYDNNLSEKMNYNIKILRTFFTIYLKVKHI